MEQYKLAKEMQPEMLKSNEEYSSGEDQSQRESMQELLERLKNEANARKAGKEAKLNHGMKITSLVYIDAPPSPPTTAPSLAKYDTKVAANLEKPFANCKTADSCDCANCKNRSSIADLINEFENQKARMITELDALKSNCNELEVTSSEMNVQVQELAKMVDAGGIALAELEQKESIKGQLAGKDFPSPPIGKANEGQEENLGAGDHSSGSEVRLSYHFQHDLRTLQKYRNIFTNKLKNRGHPKRKIEEPVEIISEKKKQQDDSTEIQKILKEKERLELQLKESYETNQYMVDKIQNLEKLINDLFQNGHSNSSPKPDERSAAAAEEKDFVGSLGDGASADVSIILELEKMKEAFEKNQTLVVVQEKQLCTQSITLSNYEIFVKDLYDCIGSIIPKPESSVVDSETVADLTSVLTHLGSCLKQILVDNGLLCKKLEALQQGLKSANSENALLNDIVVSLNDHMEELSSDNEKLLKKFKCETENCQKCALTCTSVSTIKDPEPESSWIDDGLTEIVNVGDYINKSDAHSTYVKDLKEMAKFLTTVKTTLIEKQERSLLLS